MAAKLGRTAALTWGGSAIGGVKEKGVTINGSAVDITDDNDSGWRTLLTVPGSRSVDITVSGVTKTDALKQDVFNGTTTKALTLTYTDGGVLSGTFYLDPYEDTGPMDDAITYSATFSSSGAVTYTP